MDIETRIEEVLSRLSIVEKIGQLHCSSGLTDEVKEFARKGLIGGVGNIVGPTTTDPIAVTNEVQAVAIEESRTGIPLLFGRDVIHGYRTVFPIPLGQAASFDMSLVEEAAAVAAAEASACGMHWTFTPMVDITRDPRWGRVAESGGEDPLLSSRLGAAMVRGLQGEDPSQPDKIAACAKHFAGYGATEGGRDYNTTSLPDELLRNVYLPSFKACVEAGVLTIMTAFNDLNGVPATGNMFLLRQVLREEWGFRGLVTSDWASIEEMIVHGLCADTREAAIQALKAGVDIEMFSTCYRDNLENLIAEGKLPLELLDDAVRAVLRLKFQLGLFDHPYTEPGRNSILLQPPHLEVAKRLARESCVLLKNDGALPLSPDLKSLAVIGPLADAGREQLGCWSWDGREEDCVTPLGALKQSLTGEVKYARGCDARTDDRSGFVEARHVAKASDAIVAFVGEDAVYSGEAHCRAFLDLPGAQQDLIFALAELNKPLIVVLLAGRPLTIGAVADRANAVLLAWHPGTMGGAAIADLLLGLASPSGKLPVTFPHTVGQIPVYYNHRNTGRPQTTVSPETCLASVDNPEGFVTGYLDAPIEPLYPFGYGLSYTSFSYANLRVSVAEAALGDKITVSVELSNAGKVAGTEVVQLYLRDRAASLTRPVKELKDFARITLEPGETRTVSFSLHTDQLGFYLADGTWVVEPGAFDLMVGGNSEDVLVAELVVTD